MTRRERAGLLYLPEAALALRVPWHVFAKALYHPTVSPHLSRRYRKRWGHPRRVRVLTLADCERLMRYLFAHAAAFAAFRALERARARDAADTARHPKSARPRNLSRKIVSANQTTGLRHPNQTLGEVTKRVTAR